MNWEYKWSEFYIKYNPTIYNISKQPINSLSAIFMALWVFLHKTDNNLIEQKLIIFNFISSALAHSTYNPLFILLDNESMSSTVLLYTYNNISKHLGWATSIFYFYLCEKKVEFDTRFGIITGIPITTLLVNKRLQHNDLTCLLLGCLCHYIDKQCINTNMKYLYLHSLWHILAGIAFNNILNYKDDHIYDLDNVDDELIFSPQDEHF